VRIQKNITGGEGLQNIAIQIVPQPNKTVFTSLLEIISRGEVEPPKPFPVYAPGYVEIFFKYK
jgi:hypothetical protein